MNQVLNTKRKIVAAVLAAFVVALTFSHVQVSAHGGEDHSEKKAPTISTGTNMIVRAEHVGDLEVTIKHPPLEPDKELAARVFVTRPPAQILGHTRSGSLHPFILLGRLTR